MPVFTGMRADVFSSGTLTCGGGTDVIGVKLIVSRTGGGSSESIGLRSLTLGSGTGPVEIRNAFGVVTTLGAFDNAFIFDSAVGSLDVSDPDVGPITVQGSGTVVTLLDSINTGSGALTFGDAARLTANSHSVTANSCIASSGAGAFLDL